MRSAYAWRSAPLGGMWRMVIGQSWRLTLAGVLLGAALAVALGRLMERGLLGVASSDVRLVVAFGAAIIVAGLTAGYLPARRATAIDPLTALRAE